MSAVLDRILSARPAGQAGRLAQQLTDIAGKLTLASVVAIAADNSEAWLAADLACVASGKPALPLPDFFTAGQRQWAIDSAGVDVLLTDQPDLPVWATSGFGNATPAGSLHLLTRQYPAQLLPVKLLPSTAKITFTSGSTGNPKGVCLSQLTQEAVAGSIAQLLLDSGVSRHLCALPLPVLLENVAGFYAAILAGAEVVTPSLRSLGWTGSSQWNASAFLQCIQDQRIESAIVLPQMLKLLLPLLGQFDTSSLKMLAVGGARVSADLLDKARGQGLPVYEGYGLSECSSVVCFNHPRADKPGTVGKPLPHVSVRVNGEGELEVAGSYYEAYLGQDNQPIATWLPTGDLASIDDEGFVRITGRKKNLIISSYGRNISPEWVESELLAQDGVLQAAVFGEAKPFLAAVIVAPALTDSALQLAIDTANTRLPDYARVHCYIRADEPFSASNGLATTNGRNRRDAIAQTYSKYIESLYTPVEGMTA